MKELRIGVIGTGFMGKTHTYGYQTLPFFYDDLPFKIILKGICSRTKQKANNFRDRFGFEYATIDYQELINDPEIDIINICTPNVNHKDNLLAALQANKHIYCEKPLTTNYLDAQEVLSIAKSKDLICQMVHQCRFFPATLKAKELIEQNAIGNILSFRAHYLHSGSVMQDKPIGWKQDKTVCGGGVLFDLGSHLLDLIYHLIGEYDSIFATTNVIYNKRPNARGEMIETLGDDLACLLVKMKDNSTGIIEASKIATGTNDELRFEIHGDKGAIRFNLMEPNWLEFYDNTKPETAFGGEKGFTKIETVQRYLPPGGKFPSPKASIGWLRGHVHCLYSFLNNVYQLKNSKPSLADGTYIQYVMEQAYESDKLGKWQQLNSYNEVIR